MDSCPLAGKQAGSSQDIGAYAHRHHGDIEVLSICFYPGDKFFQAVTKPLRRVFRRNLTRDDDDIRFRVTGDGKVGREAYDSTFTWNSRAGLRDGKNIVFGFPAISAGFQKNIHRAIHVDHLDSGVNKHRYVYSTQVAITLAFAASR